jgi:alpha-amylase/alpha-mannosidase (GH57 family)
MPKTSFRKNSDSPHAHPIVPLMLDIKSAHEAMPEAPLPDLESYPGGEERVRWHIEQGNATFERFFGTAPQGCWPSEGAVSDATMKVLGDAGFAWAATGGQVLHNSLHISDADKAQSIHHPFQVKDTAIPCFFVMMGFLI